MSTRAVNVFSCNNTEKTFSRFAILAWCNKLLDSNIQKIDDLCTGAAYCSLMDILFPDSINLSHVKFDSRVDRDYIHNFTVLQKCFTKLKVKKGIPIEKLINGKFQDNYEFAIWFRRFFDANYGKQIETETKIARCKSVSLEKLIT
ncbi:GH11211 [Drosophila grimshawi]|uniref:GH11211 n=1 Tax=Drosophila grimshawi TaxID=7222 RepID=B4JDL5_DROGR|nr:GH11211 [Drosophila grimshawi]